MASGTAVVAIVIIVIVGAGSLYLYSSGNLSNLNLAGGSSPTADCPTSQPLSLTSTSIELTTVELGFADNPQLSMVWSNCSSQEVYFDVSLTSFGIVYSTFGSVSQQYSTKPDVTGACSAGANGATGVVEAHSTTTVCLEIVTNNEISLNSVPTGYNGTVSAIDPDQGTVFSPNIVYISPTYSISCSDDSCPASPTSYMGSTNSSTIQVSSTTTQTSAQDTSLTGSTTTSSIVAGVQIADVNLIASNFGSSNNLTQFTCSSFYTEPYSHVDIVNHELVNLTVTEVTLITGSQSSQDATVYHPSGSCDISASNYVSSSTSVLFAYNTYLSVNPASGETFSGYLTLSDGSTIQFSGTFS